MAQNRRQNKKTRREHLAREHEAEIRKRRDEQMRLYGDDPARLHEAELDDGDPGVIFGSRRYFSRDSRLACRILSCGTISDDQQAAILKQADIMAAKFGQDHDIRKYASAMNVKLRAAQLELEFAKLVRSSIPMRPTPNPMADEIEPDDSQSLAYLEQPNLEDAAHTLALLNEFGIGIVMQSPEDCVS